VENAHPLISYKPESAYLWTDKLRLGQFMGFGDSFRLALIRDFESLYLCRSTLILVTNNPVRQLPVQILTQAAASVDSDESVFSGLPLSYRRVRRH
jgi:hypothetical protein